MEPKSQKKMNRKSLLQYILLAVLLFIAIISVNVLVFDLSPRQVYSFFGADNSRCKGSVCCFSFCNVGNGDSSLIYTEQAMGVVDFGVEDYAYSLSDKVSALTESPLDFAIISHPHSDHAGGFEVVAKTVGIRCLYIREYTSEQLEDYAYYEKILRVAEAYGIRVIHPRNNDVVQIGDITLNFYAPDFYTTDENERSLVVKATIGSRSCLYVGDSGFSTEAVLMENDFDIKADILKVGHHGSKKGSSQRFLKAVNPLYAVISVGYNSYGHPAPEVTGRLTKEGIPFYRTDGYQQIIFSVEQADLTVQCI